MEFSFPRNNERINPQPQAAQAKHDNKAGKKLKENRWEIHVLLSNPDFSVPCCEFKIARAKCANPCQNSSSSAFSPSKFTFNTVTSCPILKKVF